MTPREYEKYVASIFKERGYEVELTPSSGDYGIDVIAHNDHEKVAIQVKMYGGSSRKVNRACVMELYGAMAYGECTRALIVTNGEVMLDALEVANKLGINIEHLEEDPEFTPTRKISDFIQLKDSQYPSFDEIWENYIMPLKGKTLSNSRGRNIILEVNWVGIQRITSTGKVGKIDIEGFRFSYNYLIEHGSIKRDFINQQIDKRCSSGIFLVLEQIPFIHSTDSPKTLHLR